MVYRRTNGAFRVLALCLFLSTSGCGGGSGGSGGAVASPERLNISGSPTTALNPYHPWYFEPTLTGNDHAAAIFSIHGQPEWTHFDALTGRLAGSPSEVGVFGPITITVASGNSTVGLAPFTLQVVEASLGAATVSWVPPTEHVRGTALTDLAGYRVYYGRSRDDLPYVIDINDIGQTSHFVANLARGQWYFYVSAYTESGLESERSNIEGKRIEF